MHFALELLASGLDLEGKAWDDHVYSPTMWDDDDGKRRIKGASKSQVAGLAMLRDMKRNPSQMASHFAAQPAISKAKAAKLATSGTPFTEGVMKVTADAIKEYTLAAKKQRTDPVAMDSCPPAESTDANETRTRAEKRKVNKRAKKDREKAAVADFAAALASGTEAK